MVSVLAFLISIFFFGLSDPIELVGGLREAAVRSDRAQLARNQRELVRLGEPAVGPLIPLLEDQNTAVRDAAFAALSKIGGDRAMTALVLDARARLSEPPLYGEGAQRIASLGPRALPYLTRTYDPSGVNNMRLMAVVGRFRSRHLGAFYEAAMKDRSMQVVQSAVMAMGIKRTDGAFSRLTGLLRDQRPEVRFAAIVGLQCLGDRRATKALQGVLAAPDVPADYEMDNPPPRRSPMTLHRAARIAIRGLRGLPVDLP